MSFYNKYVELCRNAEKTPSAVAKIIGIGKSNVTYWKNGRTKPTDLTLSKIADYFNVPVSYFDEKENPTEKISGGTEMLSYDEETRMFAEIISSMTKEQKAIIWEKISEVQKQNQG